MEDMTQYSTPNNSWNIPVYRQRADQVCVGERIAYFKQYGKRLIKITCPVDSVDLEDTKFGEMVMLRLVNGVTIAKCKDESVLCSQPFEEDYNA